MPRRHLTTAEKKGFLGILYVILLLFGSSLLDKGLLALLSTAPVVDGPVFAGINADTKVFVFVFLAPIYWALAELFAFRLKSPAATTVAGALGAFYIGAAFAIAVGVRNYSWMREVGDQYLAFWVGALLYGSAFDLRFHLPRGATIAAALLCFVFWLLTGLSAPENLDLHY
jgi:hypothetical protein